MPIDSRARNQISEFWQMWPPINRELCNLFDLLSSPASIFTGCFLIFSRFFCNRSVIFLPDFLRESSLLSKRNNSDQESFCKTSSEWWFRFGKSSLSAWIISLGLRFGFLIFGILNFLVLGGGQIVFLVFVGVGWGGVRVWRATDSWGWKSWFFVTWKRKTTFQNLEGIYKFAGKFTWLRKQSFFNFAKNPLFLFFLAFLVWCKSFWPPPSPPHGVIVVSQIGEICNRSGDAGSEAVSGNVWVRKGIF